MSSDPMPTSSLLIAHKYPTNILLALTGQAPQPLQGDTQTLDPMPNSLLIAY